MHVLPTYQVFLSFRGTGCLECLSIIILCFYLNQQETTKFHRIWTNIVTYPKLITYIYFSILLTYFLILDVNLFRNAIMLNFNQTPIEWQPALMFIIVFV